MVVDIGHDFIDFFVFGHIFADILRSGKIGAIEIDQKFNQIDIGQRAAAKLLTIPTAQHFFTDAFEVGKEALLKAAQEGKNYMQMCAAAENAVKEFAKNYMRLIGSSGRFTFETVDNGSKE